MIYVNIGNKRQYMITSDNIVIVRTSENHRWEASLFTPQEVRERIGKRFFPLEDSLENK